MERPTEKEFAQNCADAVNNMGFDNKKFANAMLNEHRTLQQDFTKLCLTWLYTLAETEHFDLRNEASVAAGKAVKAALGDYGIHLPHI